MRKVSLRLHFRVQDLDRDRKKKSITAWALLETA